MRPAETSGTAARHVAGPGAGGVVPRPALWKRLEEPARVTVLSAPAGSGKTVLLRSWIGEAGLAERAAWVPAGRDLATLSKAITEARVRASALPAPGPG